MNKALWMTLILLVLFLIAFAGVNYWYKKTQYYKNKLIFVEDYLKGVPYDLKVVNLGSTYAKYAFENYDDLQLNGFNFALQSQTLNYDRIILDNYSGHLAPNCVVIIPIAACLMLYRKSDDTSLKHYAVLKKKQIPDFSWKDYIKFKLPVITARKQLIRIIKDSKRKEDIYSQFPAEINDDQVHIYMSQLVNAWKSLFNLPNLKQVNFSSKNLCDMEYITEELRKIIVFCSTKGYRPVIVIPPFSEKMNQYFSDEFANTCIIKNVEKANNGEAPLLDYRKNEFFQTRSDLYVDGGFRLNKKGSRLFMNILLDDLKEFGIILNNETAGIYSQESYENAI